MRTADAEPIEPGSTVGNLVVERELGRGAFGIVYLARDRILGRRVALKAIARPDLDPAPEAVERFLEEARVVARLNSPHVVTLYQLHERPGGRWMLEMEYVEGTTLGERIAAPEGVSLAAARRLLRGVTVGLKAAHDAGVLHRDIKPANVLIARDGTAKLTDFGLARVVTEGSMRLERDETLVGTPSYMAPEILQGGAASAASDLWSLGVMAYQLLAGRMPFDSRNLATFFFEVQNAPAPALAPVVDPQLRHFVARCLAKDPAERVASCAELLEVLDGAAEGASERVAERPTAPARERLFGRGKEVAHFESVLDRVRDGASTGILVVGEAGIGKTSLLEEIRSRASARGFVGLVATLSPFEGPLQTLVEAVQASARTERSWRTAAFGPASGIVAKLLRGEPVPELESPEQAVWALEHLFRGVATERPLFLCVEEARHAQEDDVALLAELIPRLADSRFLIALSARPEASTLSRFATLPDIERLTLDGLSGEALYAFLESSIGSASIPAEVADRIRRRSDGNPLLASEILRHLEQQGALARNGSRLEVRPGWDSDSVPQRLHDLVAARLAVLDEDDRALLEVAAADGREFDGRALAAVAGVPLIQVLRRLQELCRTKSLIVPSADGYRFANAFLQQVLYDDMAPDLRRELHRELARHLDRRGGPRDAERMVRHWEGCGERDRARPYLVEAALGAHRRQEPHRLIDFAGRAGLLSDALDASDAVGSAALVIALSSVLVRRGRRDRAARLLETLRRGAEACGDRELVLRVELEQAIAQGAAKNARAIDEARVRELADHFDRTEIGGNAHQLLGSLAKVRGDLEVAAAEFGQARGIFRSVGAHAREVSAVAELGSVALRSGRNAEAEELFTEAEFQATRIGRGMSAAISGVNRVVAAVGRGRLEGLAPVLERAIRTFDLAGSTHHAAHVRVTLAELCFAAGDLAGARRAVDEAVPALRATKHHVALGSALRLQGGLLAMQGDLAAGEVKLAEACELAEAAQDYGQQATTWVAVAQLRCFAGDAEQSAVAARIALDLVSGTPRGIGDLLLLIGEAGVYGLPSEVLAEAAAVVPDDERGTLHARVLAAARACADERGDPAALRDGADALRTEPIGMRRALLRILADWFEAEARRREGDLAGCAAAARHGLAAASTLRHAWLMAGFERMLAG